MRESQFDLRYLDEAGTARVHVRGPLDAHTCHSLYDVLASTTAETVTVDLSAVTFFDSAAAESLVAACRGGEQRGVRVLVARTSPAVERIIDLGDAELQRVLGPPS